MASDTSSKNHNRASRPPLTLRRNFSWTLAGNLIYAACQWGMLTVLAKLGNPELVGQFALALAITAPVIAFSNLQLRSVQATDAKHEFQFADYATLRILSTLTAIVVVSGLIIMGDYDTRVRLVILAVAVGKGFDSGSDVIYGLFQQHERMDFIARAMVINGVLSLFLLGIGIGLTGSLLIGVLGSSMASLVTLVAFNMPMAAKLILGQRWRSDDNQRGVTARVTTLPKTLWQITWMALPLGFVMLLVSLSGNMPRYFVETTLGQRELGIFAALAYLMVAGTTVVGALGQSASPRLAQYFANGHVKAFRALMIKLVAIGLSIGVAGALLSLIAGAEILNMLYTDEYGDRADVLFILALAAGITFAASFLGYGMTAARRLRSQVPILALVAITVFLACVLLIPEYGLQGAALAVMLGAVVQLSGSAIVLTRALQTMDPSRVR